MCSSCSVRSGRLFSTEALHHFDTSRLKAQRPGSLSSDKRKHRKFTVEQKVGLVLASFRGGRSVAELCREHDISAGAIR
jgi:Transposase